jgi:NAD(P)H-dependent FMN reductase
MKFGIISGSTRQNNPQSSKVGKYVKFYLEAELKHTTYLLDLSTTVIKYWDETFWSDYENFDEQWKLASQELHSCDAIVIICPEWNGTTPPALKNIFHLATKGEFANKPGLIITVSSSLNGAYPVSELRSSTYKNTFLNYIPQQVIIRNVNKVLNNLDTHANDEDMQIKSRLNYTLQILQVYAHAFISIRNNDIINNNPYLYGM